AARRRASTRIRGGEPEARPRSFVRNSPAPVSSAQLRGPASDTPAHTDDRQARVAEQRLVLVRALRTREPWRTDAISISVMVEMAAPEALRASARKTSA